MEETIIVEYPVHYEQERTDKTDNNNGLLFGIYYYDIPTEDINTDDMYNNEIVRVKWFKTEKERNNNLSSVYWLNYPQNEIMTMNDIKKVWKTK
jgi:hypothetical protein